MNEILRQVIIGFGANLLAPVDALPQYAIQITLPPESVSQAIAADFSRVSRDLQNVIERAEQLELEFKGERRPA